MDTICLVSYEGERHEDRVVQGFLPSKEEAVAFFKDKGYLVSHKDRTDYDDAAIFMVDNLDDPDEMLLLETIGRPKTAPLL
jgi:hypothetical protein